MEPQRVDSDEGMLFDEYINKKRRAHWRVDWVSNKMLEVVRSRRNEPYG